MNVLDIDKRAQIVACLIEGTSMRAAGRLTGAAKKTVERLIESVGNGCIAYHDKAMRKLTCKLIQVDEVWSFAGVKDKNASAEQKAKGLGSVWTWIALDSESKLIPAWHVGGRGFNDAQRFIQDLSERLAHRVQLTTDGHGPYLEAVESSFGSEIDFAQLIKLYGTPSTTDNKAAEIRYSPPICTGARKVKRMGNPDFKLISTSHIERQNLTLRMGCRRYTRLTNGYSKKVERHTLATAIHFMHYNFCRIHHTLRITPAMAAGISDHVWSLEDLIERVLTGQQSSALTA
jgi:IS1 family transposase